MFPVRPASRYLPAAAWALLLFVLSSIPGNQYPEVRIVQFDKLVHFLMYLPLGLALARAVRPLPPPAPFSAKHLAAATLLGAFYGATDEWHQALVPRRSCSLADWGIDLLAVGCGALLWRWLRTRSFVRPPAQIPLSEGRETA